MRPPVLAERNWLAVPLPGHSKPPTPPPASCPLLKWTKEWIRPYAMITIHDLKKEIPAMCEKYKIAYVDAFGSIARLEQVENSDIDLIIEFAEPRKENLSFRFFGFLHDLEDRFHHKVDILTEKSLKNPFLRAGVNRDRIRIYGD